MSGPGQVAALASVVALSLTTGCRNGDSAAPAPPEANASASAGGRPAPPIDRLAPGELAPGDQTVYGLLLPRGMTVSAQFPGVAHAAGPLAPEDVANYLRDHVDTKRIELGAVGTFFPSVHLKGGDPSRTYRIEVHSAGTGTELEIRDVTPPLPVVPDTTISDGDKWRRAGYSPDGKPLKPEDQR